MPHILLTSLGTAMRETQYHLHGRTATGLLTPLALVQLLDDKPEHVFTVVTEAAKKKTWPKYQAEMTDILGFAPEEPIEIPLGRDAEEIPQILERIAQPFPEGAELSLDITQGMRHIPFFFYAVALYLSSLRNIKIRGVYYGMVETEGDSKPIVDLQPLLELPEWFHAVRMFRDQGATLPIANLIQPLHKTAQAKADAEQPGSEDFIPLHKKARAVKRAGQLLQEHAFAYEAALPLELGKISHDLAQTVRQVATLDLEELPPLASDLTAIVANVAESRSFAKKPSMKGKWKRKVCLNKEELQRQAHMIDGYLQLDQIPLAIGLMREWVVSWLMLQSDHTEEWYNRKVREKCEWRLNTLGQQVQSVAGESTALQKRFGDFWNQLTELRNSLHHHGMRDDEITYSSSILRDIRAFWPELKAGQIEWSSHWG